jgi:hypothetical protein
MDGFSFTVLPDMLREQQILKAICVALFIEAFNRQHKSLLKFVLPYS